MEQQYKYMVRVSCMTYNHAPYIEDAMNGFCMQETSFPFVCAIVDDASTDGEQEVIQGYLNEHFILSEDKGYRRDETEDYIRIFARHKTNDNCYFVVVYLKYNHYSIKKPKGSYYSEWMNTKYIAICEGDDYWIVQDKLQRQVDFLENHPNHSLCFCTYEKLLPNGQLILVSRYEQDVEECPIEDAILGGGGYAGTNTMLYRKDLYISYFTWAKEAVVGDLPLTLTLAVRGKIGYLSDLMCVYRYSSSGSWSEQMISSFQFRRKTYLGVKKIMKQFDKWTSCKYHNFVKKKMLFDKKGYYLYEMRQIKYSIQRLFRRSQGQ